MISDKLAELKDPDYIHYDTVDLKGSSYSYHDEPHSFENSSEFMEDMPHFTFESQKPSEPIYAEPTKITVNREKSPAADSTGGDSGGLDDDCDDAVEFRSKLLGCMGDPPEHTKSSLMLNRRSDTLPQGDEKNRLSDSVTGANQNVDENGESRPMRKYHSKSFSLSENKLSLAAVSGASTLNVFQQNRDLWQKRATQSSYQNLTTSRILSRNRGAPDLVMDLPPTIGIDGVGSTSRESLDTELEDMTSAERFAAQNQCTLKKNERFSTEPVVYENSIKKEVKLDVKGGPALDKPKAEVKPQESSIKSPTATDIPKILEESSTVELSEASKASQEEILHIDECSSAEGLVAASSIPKELAKSPIPVRNTQKFVSQFADLHLTGGCLIKSTETTSAAAVTSLAQEQQAKSLSSFKPQVKVKPHILKKPQVLPPHTPEMARRGQD